MTPRDDAVARVDALVAAIGPNVSPPVINRRDAVLVAGPWLAGVSSMAAVLRQRVPQHTFVESSELAPGDAPIAVVFVVSASAPMTESDCQLLDAAAENTDLVVGVVTKVDLHLTWREVLSANRRRLAEHSRTYGQVPWIGAAAAPDAGEPQVEELLTTIQSLLADSDIVRRNRLRAWESRLRNAAQRVDRDAAGSGRRARVDALREQRSSALRHRRELRSERTITLRGQVQQAKVQLSYLARNHAASVHNELQEEIARLSRRRIPDFEEHVRDRLGAAVAEVAAGVDEHLVEVARATAVELTLPTPEVPPAIVVPAPPLKSRRLENRLTMVVGAVFGLGVALTLSRLVAGLIARLDAGLAPPIVGAGIVVCVLLGLAMTAWIVNSRGLIGDRAVLDRWVGEATASLRSALEQIVASRVLVAESLLSTEATARDEAENVRVADQVSVIDGELREHALAAARAAAMRDRQMPAIRAALDAVRAELGEPGIYRTDRGIVRAKPSSRSDGGHKPTS